MKTLLVIFDPADPLVKQRGWGGHQKIAFRNAIEGQYDVVVVANKDASSDDDVARLIEPLQNTPQLGCVLGRASGATMGSAIMSILQNYLSNSRYITWNPVSRAYSVPALKKIVYALNTNRAHFDTEVLLQLMGVAAGVGEVEIPSAKPTRVGFTLLRESLRAGFKFKLQKWNLFYDVRFHPEIVFKSDFMPPAGSIYNPKMGSLSPHSILFDQKNMIPDRSHVLDIGGASGYVADELVRRKNCAVTCVDMLAPDKVASKAFEYKQLDLESQIPELTALMTKNQFDVVLLLDILEHLAMPEKLLLRLSSLPYKTAPRFISSTANVAFVAVRVMLLFGHFNYGQKGILDITHKRLFSLHTFRNLLEQTGYVIEREHYFPFPFRELGFSGFLARFLEAINSLLIKIRPRLFAYQIMLEARPLGGLDK